MALFSAGSEGAFAGGLVSGYVATEEKIRAEETQKAKQALDFYSNLIKEGWTQGDPKKGLPDGGGLLISRLGVVMVPPKVSQQDVMMKQLEGQEQDRGLKREEMGLKREEFGVRRTEIEAQREAHKLTSDLTKLKISAQITSDKHDEVIRKYDVDRARLGVEAANANLKATLSEITLRKLKTEEGPDTLIKVTDPKDPTRVIEIPYSKLKEYENKGFKIGAHGVPTAANLLAGAKEGRLASESMAEAEATIMTAPTNKAVLPWVKHFNTHADENATYVYAVQPGRISGFTAIQVQLPTINLKGKEHQLTLGDARLTMQKQHMTMEEFLSYVAEQLSMQNKVWGWKQ